MAKLEITNVNCNNGKIISYRSLKESDASDLIEFLTQIAKETTHTMQYEGRPNPIVADVAKRIANVENSKTDVNIGAFDGEKLIGYLNLRLINPEHPWIQHLAQFGMMILQSHWGLGVGGTLLRLQEEHARAIGVSRIEAMVRVKNERGINLYNKNGYKVEGTRKKAAFINGEFVDEYFIAKLLQDVSQPWRPPTLNTKRLVLRALELADAKTIFEYASNPEVCKLTLWEPHKSVKDSIAYLESYVFPYYENETPEPFAITLQSDPTRVIGTVGCFWTSKKANAMELAYALSASFWGQGLVAEAANEVMNYCHSQLGAKRIQARCKAENVASAKVMQKIGMQYEGTLRSSLYHRNRYWDMIYYAKIF